MYVTVFSPPVKAQQLTDREAARRPQHQDVVILTHQAGSELWSELMYYLLPYISYHMLAVPITCNLSIEALAHLTR
jgi:hypothetical protein